MGGDVDARDDAGVVPVLHASVSDSVVAAERLLLAGADPDAKSKSPSDEGDGEALHALVETEDTDLKVYTSDDRLPIWYAGDVIAWLKEHLGS